MKLFLLLITIVFCFIPVENKAQTQTKTITGIILSEDSNPVEGVSVQVKGTKNISGSQADGVYFITITSKDSVLVIQHPQYETQEIKLTGETEYNVHLKRAKQK